MITRRNTLLRDAGTPLRPNANTTGGDARAKLTVGHLREFLGAELIQSTHRAYREYHQSIVQWFQCLNYGSVNNIRTQYAVYVGRGGDQSFGAIEAFPHLVKSLAQQGRRTR